MYIGVWNERYYSADYIVALHSALQQHNLSSTLIVAADDCCPPWNICNDLLTNPPLSAAVSYIGGHYPNQQTTVNCSMVGQRKWSSEDFSSEYTAGGCWARLLNRNYVYAQLTASIAWSPIAAYYDELPYSRVGLMHAAQPWSGHYDVDQAIWATAHTTHHTTIGWHYLAHGNGVGELSGGGTYVALTDGQGALTIVVEAITHEQSKCINDGYAPGTAVKQEVTFALQSKFKSTISQLYVFYSSFDPINPIIMYQYQGTIQLSNATFTFTLLPDTIYTFSTLNSTKGTHPLPPVEQLFPSHYNDSFNTATLYGQPHYFTDQSGVFELYDSTNHSHGGTLRQSIPQLPVAWCGDAAVAYTLIGNHSWRYVRVSVDVMIEKGGMAVVSSAISTGGCTGIGGSAAISFSISSSGDWILSNSTSLLYAVASGSGQYTSGVWYWVVLSVSSVSITAVVDGSVVCEIGIEEWEYGLTGWVGLGSSFDYVQFDDFEVHGEVAVKDVQRDAVISASEHDSDVEHRHRDH